MIFDAIVQFLALFFGIFCILLIGLTAVDLGLYLYDRCRCKRKPMATRKEVTE